MDKNTGISERILQILKYQGISINKFAKNLGYNRSQTLYDIINSVANPSFDFFEKFSNSEYSVLFNTDWLLTGKGDMLNKSLDNNNDLPMVNYNNSGVPYYDVDFIGGYNIVENDQTINPTYHIDFPQYNKADSWVNTTGHSMEPLINHGDMIAIKKIEDWKTYMLYGEIYAIVTDEYRTVKKVRKSTKGDNYIRLVPLNCDYDEQDIDKRIIRNVFQVVGCAKKIF